jgi:protein-S-isoprenylcysteine O-methyltransferase Ste14
VAGAGDIMNGASSPYGLWPLVVINTLFIVAFVLSIAPPRSRRDWRSFGSFAAFLVALFAEMYGFPLTIYLLSGLLGSRIPSVSELSHNGGHLWQTLFSLKGDPHLNPIHVVSDLLLAVGFILLSISWRVLYHAQRGGVLARTGPYRFVRHPQYLAFITILVAFLLEWPTVPTILLFPFLVLMYARLAKREELEATLQFGEAYTTYAASTPAFLPHSRLFRPRGVTALVSAKFLAREHREQPAAESVTPSASSQP